jgi:zinc and cadmium transporter
LDPALRSLLFWSALTTVAHLSGLYLVRARPAWTRRHLPLLTAFAGGVGLGVSLLHLLPEATERRADAGIYATLAFLVFYFLESHVRHRHRGGLVHATAHGAIEAERETRPVALMTAMAFALHSAADGVALGVAFAAVEAIGPATAIAVLAHEAPEGMAVFTLLLYGGYSVRAATIYAWVVALITPTVALTSFFTFGELAPGTLGVILGVVAGTFLYIGATDLLPEIKRMPGLRLTLAVAVGLAVPLVLRLAAHGH